MERVEEAIVVQLEVGRADPPHRRGRLALWRGAVVDLWVLGPFACLLSGRHLTKLTVIIGNL